MVLVATDEEVEELKCKLLETGLAFNIGPYAKDSKTLQSENMNGNGI